MVDVVELKYVKKFLAKSAVHTLNYYDITFITEGKGAFSETKTTDPTGRRIKKKSDLRETGKKFSATAVFAT